MFPLKNLARKELTISTHIMVGAGCLIRSGEWTYGCVLCAATSGDRLGRRADVGCIHVLLIALHYILKSRSQLKPFIQFIISSYYLNYSET